MAIFSNEDDLLGLYAAEALGQIGKPAIDFLVSALRDKNARMREDAVIALGRIAMYKRDTRSAEFLVFSLADSDVAVRKQAALALFYSSNWYKEIAAISALIMALNDNDQEVVGYAAWALGNIGDVRAIQPLVGALKYKNQEQDRKVYGSDVHKNVIEALTKIGMPAADTLLNALDDDNANIREGAAQTLGLIKEIRAIDRLIALLGDRQENVRSAAAGALKTIGQPATRPLIIALRGADEKMQSFIVQVLVTITGEKIGVDEVKWHEWWEKKNKALKK